MISIDPAHLNLWTMCIRDFDMTFDPFGTSEASPQQAYITLKGKLSHKDRHDQKLVGEIWLDENPSLRFIPGHRNEALVVISWARYFRTPKLNEMLHVYDWPASFHLYNVLLVGLVQKDVVVAGTMKTFTVAYRKGIGRVTKDHWNDTNCKLQYMRLG
ncbi:hypothetical protein VTL71DRAFT_10457 [Oculimacula yallundae]|uniref:Uncharacterized protein n=1 Tax=Oculimacula yallundae TaxID=86028 RepID=A0ABR4CUS8_9HELO